MGGVGRRKIAIGIALGGSSECRDKRAEDGESEAREAGATQEYGTETPPESRPAACRIVSERNLSY
jgi:hypothetical protein